jgi:tight adherence protein C
MNLQLWILVAVFVSVTGLIFGLGMWVTGSRALVKRFDELGSNTESSPATVEPVTQWRARMARIVTPLARLSAPKEGWENSNLRVRFMHAGMRGTGWPIAFFTGKTLLALILPGLYWLFGSTDMATPDQRSAMLAYLCLAALGYYLPNVILSLVVSSRQRELREALPDAIDLMTVCVEAGLALDAALYRAGVEMHLRSAALADELNLMTIELRIGSTRAMALQNLAVRTGVDDIETFVTTLLQSEHFGTNVAQSLRVLAETMRDHRRLRAEEAAAKISLKLLFPLIFFIFPSLLLVLIGPAWIGIIRTLLPTLSGAR